MKGGWFRSDNGDTFAREGILLPTHMHPAEYSISQTGYTILGDTLFRDTGCTILSPVTIRNCLDFCRSNNNRNPKRTNYEFFAYLSALMVSTIERKASLASFSIIDEATDRCSFKLIQAQSSSFS